MSASLLVDLGNTCALQDSIAPAVGVGSTPASGVIVGIPVDMNNANSFCNVLVAAGQSLSGQFKVLVQSSDSTASGTFTDPTSGLAQLPTSFLSGGVFICNSGGTASSGGIQSAAFQRTGRYVRAIIMSGDQNNSPVNVGFISQLRTTGSGGGYSLSPGSGVINV
jgi:hypothetical protein